jgi:pyruvate,water dikinase
MYTKTFEEINKGELDLVGGKGMALSYETQDVKTPVPPGFVILTTVFSDFLEENPTLEKFIQNRVSKINYDDIKSVDKISNDIRKAIEKEEISLNIKKEILKSFKKLTSTSLSTRGMDFVAVRSSATVEDMPNASFAGEFESYLNITKENLLESVKKCWSSVFTTRAIFYRKEQKLDEQKILIAVVVQKMVQSEVAGICFTVHPVTEDKNQIIIEAGFGFGESVVGGRITPDTYIIDKNLLKILDINISKQEMMLTRNENKNGVVEIKVPEQKQEKQKLTDKQILELAKLCVDIEKHYPFPLDIEWALEKGIFYIVQSRPITTL